MDFNNFMCPCEEFPHTLGPTPPPFNPNLYPFSYLSHEYENYPSYEYECYDPTLREEKHCLEDVLKEYILESEVRMVIWEERETLSRVEAQVVKNEAA